MSIDLTVTPSEAKEMVKRTLKAGLTPLLESQPGIGKSQLVKEIAKEWKCKLIDVRLSTCDPCDLQGLPKLTDTEAKFVPFNCFPTEDTPIPEGYNGFILFLDEFKSAPRSVLAAAYKLVLDREVGQYRLHSKCAVVCASNRTEDNAIINDMGTALQSRVVHINMRPDIDSWFNEVGYPLQYDPRLLAFLSFNKDKFCTFNPEAESTDTYACPRTYEFANKLIKDKESLDDLDINLLNGTISSSVTADFISFVKCFKRLPKIADIEKDPENIPLFTGSDSNLKFAITAALISSTNSKNVGKFLTYIQRYENSPLLNLFLKATVARNKRLLTVPEFNKAILKLGSNVISANSTEDF